mgnify:FL=1
MIQQINQHIQTGIIVLEQLLLIVVIQIHSVQQQHLIMIQIKLGINQIIITFKQQQQQIHPIMERWIIIIKQHFMRLVLNMYNLDQDIDSLIIKSYI